VRWRLPAATTCWARISEDFFPLAGLLIGPAGPLTAVALVGHEPLFQLLQLGRGAQQGGTTEQAKWSIKLIRHRLDAYNTELEQHLAKSELTPNANRPWNIFAIQ
jgi:hypothetical protein